MTTIPYLALNPALDATALARQYAATGRIQIVDLLDPRAAEALHAMLRTRDDWVQVINGPNRLFELTRPVRKEMSDAQREALDTVVYAGAREGFQFRYETIRVPDGEAERAASVDPLAVLATWLSGGIVRTFLRTVTGEPDIAFADAQATAFSPGDFLTGHDDAVAGKHRKAAYVLGLTPKWRAEWGGVLLFEGSGRVDGYVPSFNTLNLFRVPQPHHVTEVTRAAAYRRYAVTGWLRGEPGA